ncbi:MAG: UPF0175 family protein [Spirochaetaceae bacterium]|nr:MAG: UPF0175 family protein [Spirochaetaceae bacterium]
MNHLQIDYPEALPDLLQLTAREFEAEAKMAMAAKLYEMGKISSAVAADMLGMSRVSFLLQLSRYQVSTMNFDPDELMNDVDLPH